LLTKTVQLLGIHNCKNWEDELSLLNGDWRSIKFWS